MISHSYIVVIDHTPTCMWSWARLAAIKSRHNPRHIQGAIGREKNRLCLRNGTFASIDHKYTYNIFCVKIISSLLLDEKLRKIYICMVSDYGTAQPGHECAFAGDLGHLSLETSNITPHYILHLPYLHFKCEVLFQVFDDHN